ncbi:hypothetical protein BCR37DRAFT_388464 [Protomyces lactucae-debilis]|uniref:Uncharacterized protein n=1 Tax=Protomyces lactucae-debilis TaxID=2754530 RepID=A0A1Y2F972_PROLT|nr:uncharacterized protein BCR37DRAFT_388464 [Protomyces lactucae-debilis]ORY79445.1 hypothetical protein BCR37DRAFT_388464 [Protomyces lactucae-debilis]
MLRSLLGLICFARHVSLHLSLLSSIHQGIRVRVNASNCIQYDTEAYLMVERWSPHSDCEFGTEEVTPKGCWSFAGKRTSRSMPDDEEALSTGFHSEPRQEATISCKTISSEHIADLIYSTARARVDLCLHVMNTSQASFWDVLFRDPVSKSIIQDTTCECTIKMAVQRITTNPPRSTNLEILSNCLFCRPNPFDVGYCATNRLVDRMFSFDMDLRRETWYPKLTQQDDSRAHQIHHGGWGNLVGDQTLPFNCDAELRDEFANQIDNMLSNDNCTIKFYKRADPLYGNIGICCIGVSEHMSPIIKRLALLYENDPLGLAHRKQRQAEVNSVLNELRRWCVNATIHNDLQERLVEGWRAELSKYVQVPEMMFY